MQPCSALAKVEFGRGLSGRCEYRVQTLSGGLYRLRIAGMNQGLRVETFIALGEPAVYLVRKARQLRVSLLIVAAAFGLHGHEKAEPIYLHIVREAMCPVLVTP